LAAVAGCYRHRCATDTRHRPNSSRRQWLRSDVRKVTVVVVGSVAGIAIQTRMIGANPCCLVVAAEAAAAIVTFTAAAAAIVAAISRSSFLWFVSKGSSGDLGGDTA